jgi:hypothetical protein
MDEPNAEAPWGYKPDGTPYKRNPAPFAHLKGKAFGTKSSEAKAMDQAALPGKPPKARRVKDTTPPKHSKDWYAEKISTAMDVAGSGLALRGDRAKGAGLMLRINADELGKVWGPVAVSKPIVGRTIDKLTTQSEVGLAVGTSVGTLAMMARATGIVPDGHPLAKFIDAMIMKKITVWMMENPQEWAAWQAAAEGGDSGDQDAGISVTAAG